MSNDKIIAKKYLEMENLLFRHGHDLNEQNEQFQLEIEELYGEHLKELKSIEYIFMCNVNNLEINRDKKINKKRKEHTDKLKILNDNISLNKNEDSGSDQSKELDKINSILKHELKLIDKGFKLKLKLLKTEYSKDIEKSIEEYYKNFTELNCINKNEIDEIIKSQISERKALSKKYSCL